MQRNHLILPGVLLFLAGPINADISNVQSGGDASGYVIGQTVCSYGFCSNTSNLTGPNTQSPPATVASDDYGDVVTVSALSQQTTVASSENLQVSYVLSAIVDGTGTQWFAEANLNGDYYVSFQLTEQSAMHLTASGSGDFNGAPWDSWFLLDSDANPVTPYYDLYDHVDQTLILAPDCWYTLVIQDNGNRDYGMEAGNAGPAGGFIITDSLSLNADFTPIPEPGLTALLPAALLCFFRAVLHGRRRQVSVS